MAAGGGGAGAGEDGGLMTRLPTLAAEVARLTVKVERAREALAS